MSTVKMIKKDAIISIQIGTGFLQKLQKMLMFVTLDVTKEDLDLYTEITKEGKEFTEDWMEHLTTLSVLIKEIETKAEEQGHTYDANIENIKIEDIQ